ncbi:MAG: hypothetical protein AAGF12_09150 [Myxococcota bacterium]
MKRVSIIFVCVALGACGDDDANLNPEPDGSTPDGSGGGDASIPDATVDGDIRDDQPTVAIREDGGNRWLVDQEGQTLYLFGRDIPGASASSNCAGDCAATWPPFAPENLRVGEGLEASDFAEITRDGGETQLTYRGWPLYRFMNDAAPGDLNGDGVGGVWFTVPDPFYTVLVRADDTLGRYLVDAGGQTLYYFARDLPAFDANPAVSNCADGCAAAWPAFETAEVRAPSTLDSATFGTVGGGTQVTYRGWPIYRFTNDTSPGDTNGENASDRWFVASDPHYDALIMSNDDTPLYLAAGNGMSLYLFRNDTRAENGNPPVSACNGPCLGNWPIFTAASPGAPSVLEGSDFTILMRDDGSEQVVYRGWPLYFFSGDTAPGDTNGVGPVWEVFDPSAL